MRKHHRTQFRRQPHQEPKLLHPPQKHEAGEFIVEILQDRGKRSSEIYRLPLLSIGFDSKRSGSIE